MSKIEFESALGQFLAGTFHQDWTAEATDSRAAIESVIARTDSYYVRHLLEELREFTATIDQLNEKQIEDSICGICDYCPEQDGKGRTYREWIQEIELQLAASLDHESEVRRDT